MNRRTLWLVGAGAFVLALVVAWWFQTYERVEQDVDVPPRGEARYNPLFGLKKVLQARGVTVESRANLNLKAMHPRENDTIVLAADVRTLSRPEVDELLEWIGSGGHLVFALPPGSEGRAGDLLDDLELRVIAHFECVRWPAGTDTAEHCFPYAFKPAKAADAKDFELLLGDVKQGYWLGRQADGDGSWTVVGNLGFLYTQELKRPGYAAFAWQVLAPTLRPGGTVHLVYAADVPPWHVLLVRYGWPALVPALLALLAWLWARSQRFGPLLAMDAAHRRALREHIQAAGEFTFRRGRWAALYAPLRRAFDERLRRDDPALAALEGDALIETLAKRNAQSPAAVRLALEPQRMTEPEPFFVVVKTLTELRAKP